MLSVVVGYVFGCLKGVFEWYLQMSEPLWCVGEGGYLRVQSMQAQVRLEPSSHHFGTTPEGKIICDLLILRHQDIKTSYESLPKMMELCYFISFLSLLGRLDL